MTSVDFAWVVCLNMLSFVAHIHVLFLPALFSRVEAIANLINYDTNATGFFGSSSGYFGSSCYPCYPCYPPHTIPHYDRESSGYLGSSGPLRDSSGPLRDTSALRDSLYACAGWEHTLLRSPTRVSRSLFWSRSFYGYPFVLSTNQNEPPPQLNGDY